MWRPAERLSLPLLLRRSGLSNIETPLRSKLKAGFKESRPLFDRQIISSIIDSILFVKEGNVNQTFKELACLPGYASTANC